MFEYIHHYKLKNGSLWFGAKPWRKQSEHKSIEKSWQIQNMITIIKSEAMSYPIYQSNVIYNQ